MPKTKVERNRAYRQRLRAKARAWDHAVNAITEALVWIPRGSVMDARTTAVRRLTEALQMAEQANGQA